MEFRVFNFFFLKNESIPHSMSTQVGGTLKGLEDRRYLEYLCSEQYRSPQPRNRNNPNDHQLMNRQTKCG